MRDAGGGVEPLTRAQVGNVEEEERKEPHVAASVLLAEVQEALLGLGERGPLQGEAFCQGVDCGGQRYRVGGGVHDER